MQNAMRVLILPLEDEEMDKEIVDTLISISKVSSLLAQILKKGDDSNERIITNT